MTSVTRLKEWPKTGQDGKTPGGRVIGSRTREAPTPDPNSPQGMVTGTIDEVVARLESVGHVAALDEIAAAESASKDRRRVHEAIERRRVALQPDPNSPAGIVAGTIDEVTARLETADTAALDEIAAAETAGQNRVGVHEAIERRRAALAAGTAGV